MGIMSRSRLGHSSSCEVIPMIFYYEIHHHMLIYLREHLYRSHRRPIHCSRCYQIFKSESLLIGHQRAPIVCPVQSPAPIEGFCREQEKMLKCRKKDSSTMNEEDKWRKVYRILFPNDDEG